MALPLFRECCGSLGKRSHCVVGAGPPPRYSCALRLFLYEGSPVSAQEALEMGLVDFVVPADRLRAETAAYAVTLAKKPAGTLAVIRNCITVGMERPFEQALRLELDAAIALGSSRDFAEGLQAFLEKRTPKWE